MALFDHKIVAAEYTYRQFAMFRIALGGYLFIHFSLLLPYAAELFSSEGVFGDPALNFTYGYFPCLLNVAGSPAFVQLFIATLAAGSLLFAAGLLQRAMALLLWYGWACLLNRNNLIINPGMPYVGWLLLLCACIPGRKSGQWEMPAWCIAAAWLLMALGYTLSGLDKLRSPSWVNGDTLGILLNNPLCRDTWLRDISLLWPGWVLKLLTWSIFVAELLFLPLALFGRTRRYAWLSMVLLHAGILCYIDFADLTAGMLMIHVFTFDRLWLERFKGIRTMWQHERI